MGRFMVIYNNGSNEVRGIDRNVDTGVEVRAFESDGGPGTMCLEFENNFIR